MSLKFDRVLPQVQTMGRAVAYRADSASERGQRAIEMLTSLTDLEEIHRKIELVRDRDAGYRGAAAFEEAIHQTYRVNSLATHATILAADGSQIYPDHHAATLYYLTNIGIFSYFHGSDELPTEDSEPALFYNDTDLRDHNGHGSVIKNTVVNARRTVRELQSLADFCITYREQPASTLGLRDGPLLWWLGGEIPYREGLENDYYNALYNFHTVHLEKRRNGHNASLVGYVERGDSRFVVRLLHLLSLPDAKVTRTELETAGPFEGLDDYWLFARILDMGERSAVMIQQSPENKRYRLELGEPYEILFFYLNVGIYNKAHIVRIEIPMWVAQTPGAVDEVHSLILQQCEVTGSYPYALTRADELAVISGAEKHQLEEMITIELLRNQQEVEKSPKQLGKEIARAPRQRYGV